MPIPVIWFVLLGLGLAVTIAATAQPVAHIAVTCIVCLVYAVYALREQSELKAAGASQNKIAAVNSRNMALIWVWGAIALFVTYLLFLTWREWLTFTIAFAVVGALCLFFANQLARDEAKGTHDETMHKVARYLTIGQLVGMTITMVGLILDSKMTRFLNPQKGWEDWAANNICFFGALGLAIISAYVLWSAREDDKQVSDA